MTDSQIDYLWALATREGEERELKATFPEVDWDAAAARKEARWEARRTQAALTPQPRISLDQVNEITKSIFTEQSITDLFSDSPLLGKFTR